MCQSLLCTMLLHLLLLLLIGTVESEDVTKNATIGGLPLPPSRWLKRVVKNPRAIGCWNRPWICNDDGPRFPPPIIKRLCCKNRCVDVSSDVNNCGLCGIRCPFTWQCCRGLCINTNVNPFHCGKCWNKCAFGSLCFYGMCGYAHPLPPFPFPLPPKLSFPPRRPFPLPPKVPFPPHHPIPLSPGLPHPPFPHEPQTPFV